MSLEEKKRHQQKSISRARSVFHKHDGHKMSTVVNHVHFERLHGFESTKHKLKHQSNLRISEQLG